MSHSTWGSVQSLQCIPVIQAASEQSHHLRKVPNHTNRCTTHVDRTASPAETFDWRSGVALGGGDGSTLETTGAAGGNETDLQTTSGTSDPDMTRDITTGQKQTATRIVISHLTLSKQHALIITAAMTEGMQLVTPRAEELDSQRINACTHLDEQAAEVVQEPHLLSRGRVAAHGGSMTDVLVVTTTVGVLHRIHGHTTHLQAIAARVRSQPAKQSDAMHTRTRRMASHANAGHSQRGVGGRAVGWLPPWWEQMGQTAKRMQHSSAGEAHLGPAVALHAELVVRVAGLQQRLLCAAPSSDLTHHRAARARQHLKFPPFPP